MVWEANKKFRLNLKIGLMVKKWTGRKGIIISDQ